jgi:hypothetical protein
MGRWPLHPRDLLAPWLIERELARQLTNKGDLFLRVFDR